MTVNEANILNEFLVPRDNIIIPTLHIKLGLMKKFVKTLPVHGCYSYCICNFFPGMSNEKLIERVFSSPLIRKNMRDQGCVESMTVVESAVWISFSLVVKNFLGNTKADNSTIKSWSRICFLISKI